MSGHAAHSHHDAHGGHGDAHSVGHILETNFSEDERRMMNAEDSLAWRRISMIMLAVVITGTLLMTITLIGFMH